MNYFDLRHKEIGDVLKDDYFAWHSHTSWMMRFERCVNTDNRILYKRLCDAVIKGIRAAYEA